MCGPNGGVVGPWCVGVLSVFPRNSPLLACDACVIDHDPGGTNEHRTYIPSNEIFLVLPEET